MGRSLAKLAATLSSVALALAAKAEDRIRRSTATRADRPADESHAGAAQYFDLVEQVAGTCNNY
ncbi:hypothetical protein [Mycobacterium lepromatosis]|uniref:hypothetical protein n=1 Tax=Mycobacterium lepromatosis TaxID=480418 RepID=UPI0005F78371|nr:hypothetical protein [Mycobacterium lepromatosis]UKN42592.1 hypothetical protein MLPF_2143 [Mycobacterium lepromatosis]